MAAGFSIFSYLMLSKGCCLAFVLALLLPIPVSGAAHGAASSLFFLLLGGDTAQTGTTRRQEHRGDGCSAGAQR